MQSNEGEHKPFREQEGYGKAVNAPEGELLKCNTVILAHDPHISDFKGAAWKPAHQAVTYSVEWDTSPAGEVENTAFVWIGGSQVRPVRPAYPYIKAKLYVDGVYRLCFPLGRIDGYAVCDNGFILRFEPRRFTSLVEDAQRMWHPEGVSGVYRLEVKQEYLTKGQPLRLRAEIEPSGEGYEAVFYVSPRKDALRVDVESLREELSLLQNDIVQLKKSHEMLYAQVYPHLFPKKLPGKVGIINLEETLHHCPASVTVMRDGEIVVTARLGEEHIGLDGRVVLFRSMDNGQTWGKYEKMYDLGNVDHRSAPIFELPNGEWVTTDYRLGKEAYSKEGFYTGPKIYSVWGAWSSDRGKTWTLSENPVFVPGRPPYLETERNMIQLPGGRLLLPAMYQDEPTLCDGLGGTSSSNLCVHYSDDNGRNWNLLATTPRNPLVTGEPSIIRAKSGKIIMVARSEGSGYEWMKKGCLFQSDSCDDGKTWTMPRPTDMIGPAVTGHLLQLADGRIMCTHASRLYPGSIYVTVSSDEGETWDTDNTRILVNDIANYDSCYPNSGQMADGTIISVWYNNLFGKFFINYMLFRPEDI